jgi:uncharacterized protein YbbK (DUF523 family)
MPDAIKIGVSACLLGEKVRYDGGHKYDPCITDTLGRFFSFVPVCPEVECGLPVPREAMRLEGAPAHPRLVTVESRVDLTERMLDYCLGTVGVLDRAEISGFIFKSSSPSCGLSRVAVFSEESTMNGRGLFAAAVVERFPLLPVEEEGRLYDPEIREDFIERVCAFRSRQSWSSST